MSAEIVQFQSALEWHTDSQHVFIDQSSSTSEPLNDNIAIGRGRSRVQIALADHCATIKDLVLVVANGVRQREYNLAALDPL